MLAAKVEDMLNTVVRQIAFYSFERKVHSAPGKPGVLSETRWLVPLTMVAHPASKMPTASMEF